MARRFFIAILPLSWLLLAALPAVALASAEGAERGYSLTEDLPFWGIVAFVGFVIALKFLGWDAFVSGMKNRESVARDLIAEAENQYAQAEADLIKQKGLMEALDEEIRDVLEEADRDALQARELVLQVARQESEAALRRAETEIKRVKDQSLGEIFETVSTQVAKVAEQRIRERLGPEGRQRLIDETLDAFVSSST